MTGYEDATTLILPAAGADEVEVQLAPNVVAGRYRVLDVLGRGGMGVVYRVVDLQDRVTRAMKVALLSRFNPLLLERMAAEAAILTFLRHPNLVAVHDMGTDAEHALHYAVMDLAAGGSASALRDEHGPLPLDQIASLGLQLCCVLDMLHVRGILHRDIKPPNLLLGAEGQLLLTDLGISKIPDASGEETDMDQVMGSFAYMAPEQRLGMDTVTEQSDLYAVGTTLYNLASGATSMDLFALPADHPRWQKVPAELRPILYRATRLAPEERPASALELGRELAPLVPRELFEAQPHLAAWLFDSDGTGPTPPRHARRVDPTHSS